MREDKIALGVGVLIGAAIAVVLWAGISGSIRQKAEFMAECQQHQPKYECTAMWRDSTPATTTIYQGK